MISVLFSIDLHDSDGDVTERCLLLYLNKGMILKLDDSQQLDELINELQKIKKEVNENYPNR